MQEKNPIDEFQAHVTDAPTKASPKEREDNASDICLSSRSAYFDFFVDSTVNRRINWETQSKLNQLFQEALTVMDEGEYKKAVERRYQDFKDFCGDKGVVSSKAA